MTTLVMFTVGSWATIYYMIKCKVSLNIPGLTDDTPLWPIKPKHKGK